MTPARIREIMADADKLPTPWDKWFYAAEKGLRGLHKQGMIVEKIYLDPDEFPRWCAALRHNIDAKARIRFRQRGRRREASFHTLRMWHPFSSPQRDWRRGA